MKNYPGCIEFKHKHFYWQNICFSFCFCENTNVFSSHEFILTYTVYYHLRNRSALAVNCFVIIHCLEVRCKEDKITIYFDSNTINNKNTFEILELLPTFRHCTEELLPILRLGRIGLRIFVTSFKLISNVTLSNAMNDVIFQQQITSAGTHFPRPF